MPLPKDRFGQVRQFVKAAKSDKPIETGDQPAESNEEIRFKIACASLPPNLSEKAIQITHVLFRRENPDAPQQPKQYSTSFYQTGNVVLAYIATQLPDIVEPFESKELPYPEDEEAAKDRIRQRAKDILKSANVQTLITENRGIFDMLDETIELFRETRSKIVGLLGKI